LNGRVGGRASVLSGGHRTKEPAELLSPHEQDLLMVHVAAMVARDRRKRGILLNNPEAVALLTSFVMEAARDGRGVVER
jgi:urease subunit gamma